MQNFIKLTAALHELSCASKKNYDENNTLCRYREQQKRLQMRFHEKKTNHQTLLKAKYTVRG